MTPSERRKDARMEAHLFTVFRRLPKKKKEAGVPEVGYTRDISVGGVYFYTQSDVKKGERVSLAVHVTSDWAEGGSPPKLEGEGKVLRVERARTGLPPNDLRGVAVQFAQEVAVSF